MKNKTKQRLLFILINCAFMLFVSFILNHLWSQITAVLQLLKCRTDATLERQVT